MIGNLIANPEYKLFDETTGELAPALMHDAARPFVVVCIRLVALPRVEGRYETRKGAQNRIRSLKRR